LGWLGIVGSSENWCITWVYNTSQGEREVWGGVFSSIGLNGVLEFIHNREMYSTRA